MTWPLCAIGAPLGRGEWRQQRWKKRNSNGAAAMSVGLNLGGLAAGISANGIPRKLTGRKLRVHAGEVEMKHDEEVAAARTCKDRVEKSLLFRTKSEIVQQDRFSLEDYFSVFVRKAGQSAAITDYSM